MFNLTNKSQFTRYLETVSRLRGFKRVLLEVSHDESKHLIKVEFGRNMVGKMAGMLVEHVSERILGESPDAKLRAYFHKVYPAVRDEVGAAWAAKVTLRMLQAVKETIKYEGDSLKQAEERAKLTQVAESFGFDFAF